MRSEGLRGYHAASFFFELVPMILGTGGGPRAQENHEHHESRRSFRDALRRPQPMIVPGVGEYVAFRDTEGNRHSIIQPLPQSMG